MIQIPKNSEEVFTLRGIEFDAFVAGALCIEIDESYDPRLPGGLAHIILDVEEATAVRDFLTLFINDNS